MAQKGKYLGNYIAKVEVVGGSGHSFQCWKTPRKSFFNGSRSLSQTNETAFTFMYSHTRNPYPTDISLDVKTFLTKLRNYYTQRGNTFYNIEVGKNTSDMIQVQINYNNNVITVKEGTNFKINLISSLFRRGNVVSVVAGGKTTQYRLQQDANYAKNNMKLFCDPNYGFDSYPNLLNLLLKHLKSHNKVNINNKFLNKFHNKVIINNKYLLDMVSNNKDMDKLILEYFLNKLIQDMEDSHNNNLVVMEEEFNNLEDIGNIIIRLFPKKINKYINQQIFKLFNF